jgi:hypothetical protein
MTLFIPGGRIVTLFKDDLQAYQQNDHGADLVDVRCLHRSAAIA